MLYRNCEITLRNKPGYGLLVLAEIVYPDGSTAETTGLHKDEALVKAKWLIHNWHIKE